jgi:hypothetical protein
MPFLLRDLSWARARLSPEGMARPSDTTWRLIGTKGGEEKKNTAIRTRPKGEGRGARCRDERLAGAGFVDQRRGHRLSLSLSLLFRFAAGRSSPAPRRPPRRPRPPPRRPPAPPAAAPAFRGLAGAGFVDQRRGHRLSLSLSLLFRFSRWIFPLRAER